MKILNRYLARTVVLNTLLALTVLVVLLTFFAFIDDLGDIGKGHYGLPQALQFALLRVPQRIYELLPVSALLGSLLGLGALASNNELVAMRTAGVSIAWIVVAAMKTGLLLMVVAIFLGEVVAPPSEQLAQGLRAAATKSQISFTSGSGYWARYGRNFINIREILPGSHLNDLFIYELDENRRLRVATHARSALYRDGQWFLQDVAQSIIAAKGVEVRRKDQSTWRSLLKPDMLRVVTLKPEDLSARGLRQYIAYLEHSGLDSRRYQLAFWGKIVQPLDLLVMLFLSIPFVFGPLRSVTLGQRILVGALVGIAFSVLSKAFSHMGLVYGLDPLFSIALPSLLFLGMGVYAVRRVR